MHIRPYDQIIHHDYLLTLRTKLNGSVIVGLDVQFSRITDVKLKIFGNYVVRCGILCLFEPYDSIRYLLSGVGIDELIEICKTCVSDSLSKKSCVMLECLILGVQLYVKVQFTRSKRNIDDVIVKLLPYLLKNVVFIIQSETRTTLEIASHTIAL